jgi:hypothetical protein
VRTYVVVNGWDGAVVLRLEHPPGAADLERIAAAHAAENGGDPPVVRTIEGFRFRSP